VSPFRPLIPDVPDVPEDPDSVIRSQPVEGGKVAGLY
jgi:hypothetical protein